MNERTHIRPAKGYWRHLVPAEGYLVCRVTAGRDWWDLDDELGALPGAHVLREGHSAYRWHVVPMACVPQLLSLNVEHTGRIRMHHAR
jgi:hypothetical protein